MAQINLTIKSDFDKAAADIKSIGQLTEKEAARIEKFQKSFKNDAIDSFIQKNQRAAAAITATRGPVEGLAAEHAGLRREIERLIRNGLNPQDEAVLSLKKRYQQLDAEIEDAAAEAKKASSKFSLMDGVMVGLGASVISLAQNGFSKLIEVSKESAEAASEAQEILSKYEVVFDSVTTESNRMANALAEDFDLAGSTARKLLGNTGDLLTGFGLAADEALNLSDQTNRLAIDLASFTNARGGAEAVSKALTSAYSGEREALKTYGIVINDAMVKAEMLEQAQQGLTFSSEQQAKIYATLALATEQSKNAIGDYARTADSAANVSRRLNEAVVESKEHWGAFVLEALTPAKNLLADILTTMNSYTAGRKAFDAVMVNGARDVDTLTEAAKWQEHVINELNLQKLRGINVTKKLEEAETSLHRVNSMLSLAYVEEENAAISLNAQKAAAVQLSKEAELAIQAETEALTLQQEQLIQNTAAQEALWTAQETRQSWIDEWVTSQIEAAEAAGEAERNLTAIVAQQEAARLAVRQATISATGDLLSGLASIFSNFSDESREAAILEKGLASASAAINSYLAFTRVLAEVPFPANTIAAAAVLASGLAQQIKILSTPIPAETGGNFVVPESAASSRGDSQLYRFNPGENIHVTPRGESIAGNLTVVAKLDESVIWEVMQKGVDAGEVVVSGANL